MKREGAVALFVAVVACGLAGGGCASATAAYERSGSRLEEGEAGFQFNDLTIRESFEMRQQIAFPVRLAVAGVERNPYGVFEDPESHRFEAALGTEDGVFADVMPLPDFMGGRDRRGCTVDALRRAAARAHADALLLYDQEVSIREEGTALQVLNLTLVGLWVVPSRTWEVALDTRAALVDVRNGVVYTTARDARSEEGMAPAALVDGHAREAKRRLREASFAALRESLAEKIARLRARETGETR